MSLHSIGQIAAASRPRTIAATIPPTVAPGLPVSGAAANGTTTATPPITRPAVIPRRRSRARSRSTLGAGFDLSVTVVLLFATTVSRRRQVATDSHGVNPPTSQSGTPASGA